MVRREATTGCKSFFDDELSMLLENGYIREVVLSPEELEQSWFLTDFVVENLRKTTSVRRVVFNCSEEYLIGGTRYSLNDTIVHPSNNISPLISVLRRGRQHAVLAAADVSKMFWELPWGLPEIGLALSWELSSLKACEGFAPNPLRQSE